MVGPPLTALALEEAVLGREAGDQATGLRHAEHPAQLVPERIDTVIVGHVLASSKGLLRQYF
ncbi:hypothetical protein EEB13_15200 [Rhodococcus sp. WS3]|nr:hypothetical protein EEB13_15200 [Rhodococcus sp. WS3]